MRCTGTPSTLSWRSSRVEGFENKRSSVTTSGVDAFDALLLGERKDEVLQASDAGIELTHDVDYAHGRVSSELPRGVRRSPLGSLADHVEDDADRQLRIGVEASERIDHVLLVGLRRLDHHQQCIGVFDQRCRIDVGRKRRECR